MTRLARRRQELKDRATTGVDLIKLGTGTGFVRAEEAITGELPPWGDEFLGYELVGRNGATR